MGLLTALDETVHTKHAELCQPIMSPWRTVVIVVVAEVIALIMLSVIGRH